MKQFGRKATLRKKMGREGKIAKKCDFTIRNGNCTGAENWPPVPPLLFSFFLSLRLLLLRERRSQTNDLFSGRTKKGFFKALPSPPLSPLFSPSPSRKFNKRKEGWRAFIYPKLEQNLNKNSTSRERERERAFLFFYDFCNFPFPSLSPADFTTSAFPLPLLSSCSVSCL